MKGKTLFAVIVFLSAFVLAPLAVKADLDGKEWQLINRDAKGNLLYMAPAAMEKPANGIKRVWMKFETQAENSPSPMLFLNEVNCTEGLIKRLEVELYTSKGSESGEPFRSISFDGKWDRPSEGNENLLYETVCRMDKDQKM